MLEINAPDVVAEVTACCEAYERALVTNDVPALQAFFWDSPHTIRFGAAEQLYGAGEISAFRSSRVINFAGRKSRRLTVLVLGRDTAVAMLEFSALVNGSPRHGRQTQVWARFPDLGWRVTAAHVSHVPPTPPTTWQAYADSAATAIGLPLSPDHRPGVVANLEATASIAKPLLEFKLPADVEIAPVFVP